MRKVNKNQFARILRLFAWPQILKQVTFCRNILNSGYFYASRYHPIPCTDSIPCSVNRSEIAGRVFNGATGLRWSSWWHGRSVGVFFCGTLDVYTVYTLPKTNSSPLKIGQAPKGKGSPNKNFQGLCEFHGRVIVELLQRNFSWLVNPWQPTLGWMPCFCNTKPCLEAREDCILLSISKARLGPLILASGGSPKMSYHSFVFLYVYIR